LEVKEAFIQAVRGGGIDEASINEVRAKHGIPVETKLTPDRHEMRDMMEARFRPLTRQYVRVLLDRYASGGVGRTAESLAAVNPKDFAAAKKTAATERERWIKAIATRAVNQQGVTAEAAYKAKYNPSPEEWQAVLDEVFNYQLENDIH
jgi:hypothetical protein